MSDELARLKQEVSNLRLQFDIAADANACLTRELSAAKAESAALRAERDRDGNWLDKDGACKVCDGEIPHGHTPNCDIFKLEQEVTKAENERDQLRAEVERLTKACDAFSNSEIEQGSVRAQLEQAREDTKRLDFIESIGYAWRRYFSGHESLREGIDAKRAALMPAKQPAEG